MVPGSRAELGRAVDFAAPPLMKARERRLRRRPSDEEGAWFRSPFYAGAYRRWPEATAEIYHRRVCLGGAGWPAVKNMRSRRAGVTRGTAGGATQGRNN